ncbi:hypothetical protein [Lutimaribacter marinistellae]
MVRPPGVMMGYWRNPDASEETVDKEGWLHTGDVAYIVEGRVNILGRLKDLLVFSTGENVNPAPIETAVLTDPLIDQACILGDSKPWCSAVVVVDADRFHNWAKRVCPEAQSVNDRGLSAALTKRLSDRMERVPPFARIRAVYIETHPWSLESGLITPTLKAKHSRIAVHYAQKLEYLYSRDDGQKQRSLPGIRSTIRNDASLVGRRVFMDPTAFLISEFLCPRSFVDLSSEVRLFWCRWNRESCIGQSDCYAREG